jgi:hypothetical protein
MLLSIARTSSAGTSRYRVPLVVRARHGCGDKVIRAERLWLTFSRQAVLLFS